MVPYMQDLKCELKRAHGKTGNWKLILLKRTRKRTAETEIPKQLYIRVIRY